MSKLMMILFAFFTGSVAMAQFPGMPGGGQGGKMSEVPAIGVVYGKLTGSSGEPLNGASVLVMGQKFDTVTKKMKQVLLQALTTRANGNFRFEKLPVVGALTLKVSNTGFEPMEQKFNILDMSKMASLAASQGAARPTAPGQGGMPAFNIPDMEKDLGTLQLKVSAKELEAVTIVASKPGLKMDIDKKVFSVEKNIVSAGGTAVDVMRNVPSVMVDIDGNVSLRNAAPQIYVDGRPTTLTLEQIPADAIESVEVITNPSAKYDASGGNAGILNIVLKKNKRNGYNGNVNAGVDKRGGINGGLNFNVRQDKINFSIASFTNQMRMRSTSSTEIENLLTNPHLLVNQQGNSRNKGGFLFGKVGMDYFATNKATFSAGLVRVQGKFKPRDVLQSDSLLENGTAISFSERNTSNNREFNAYGFNAGYKQLFTKSGRELTADINVFSGKNNGDAYYSTDLFASQGGIKKGNIVQQIIGSGSNRFTTLQTDYVTPLKGNGKVETGVRVQLRSLENRQGNYFTNPVTGKLELIPSASANYQNKDNIYAAYFSMTKSVKNFGYQIGLRAESSDYLGELTDTKKQFENRYPLSLFPSVFLSQKLKKDQELQANFSRRVNRPFFMQLIPFIDSTDQLNWSVGNAGLKPEFTSSFEASYSKKLKGGHSILASAYFKHTDDLITRYIDTISTALGAKRPINTFVNANSSRSIGLELTSTNRMAKWWDMTTNINFYNAKVNTDNIAGKSQDALWSWFGKWNNNFTLNKGWKVQLSGVYQSKTNLPVNQGGGFGGPGGGGPPMGGAQSAAQGYIKSSWAADAAFSKTFLKNNAATLTFSVSDIFGTRRMDQYSESIFFIQQSHRLGDVPMFRLNFSFRFGQMDLSLLKRKNLKGEMEGQQGAMQGIQ
jgi:ferric enterobactin receptor